VKSGDLDFSADITEQTNGFLLPPVGTVTLCGTDEILVAGQETLIPIRAKDFVDIAAFQFTIAFDTAKLDYVELGSERIAVNQINDDPVSSGIVSALWLDDFSSVTIEDGEILFYVKIIPKESLLLSEAFVIDDSFIELDAYNLDLNRLTLSFEFCDLVANEDLNQKKLLKVENSPNPFSEFTHINFQITDSEQVTLTIFDISGKKIRTIQKNFPSGMNSFLIEKKDLGSDGLYFYEVKTTENIGIGKMILH